MVMNSLLPCVMPWKSLFMEEKSGKVVGLPCCLSWVKADYGEVQSSGLIGLWNSEGSQRIRYLIANGHQEEVCSKICPNLINGAYSESQIRVVDGPPEFVANQVLNNEEIRLRKSFLQSKPMLLKVIPTLECNLRCKMCFQKSYQPCDFGPYLWEEIKQLYSCLHEITFQGGEVTGLAEFREFLLSKDLEKHPNINVSLITNGTILDNDFFDSIRRIHLHQITVSLNAATESTYHKITRTYLFNDVIKNIQRLKEISETHPIKSFTLFLSFVVMKSNFHELPKFLEIAEHFDSPVQLVPVMGDQGDENVFLESNLHYRLRNVLRKSLKRFPGPTAFQIRYIENILSPKISL